MDCPKCHIPTRKTMKETYCHERIGPNLVYIKNITIESCSKCLEKYLPERMKRQLHLKIAEWLITRSYPLAGKAVLFLRNEMDLTGDQLAELLITTRFYISRLENRQAKIDPLYDFRLRSHVIERLFPEEPVHGEMVAELLRIIRCTYDPDESVLSDALYLEASRFAITA
jgi:transcriptional regulator with XRE-family HTH domain